MANTFYLAMTAAEFSLSTEKPAHLAWMACHFSPYGAGLSNCPNKLPDDSLLILNDRIPPQGHDADLIANKLQELYKKLNPAGVLLDFQRPGCSETSQIAQKIVTSLPCSVAVSHHYAQMLDCPVFLPPPSICVLPDDYFKPWAGREVWMEVYDQWEVANITSDGCHMTEKAPKEIPIIPHFHEELRCKYGVSILDDRAIVTMHRGKNELLSLPYPITKFVGLWQEYHDVPLG